MLEIAGLAGLDVSGRWHNPPAIHWTAPPSMRGYVISPAMQTMRVTSPVTPRPLSAQEEALIWAALRGSSELVHRF